MTSKLIGWLFSILFFVFVCVVNGAIPFVAIPTLGQAMWSIGFAQSFANESIFTIHALNIGIPKPAAISFGLSGVYPASIFIRMGMHPVDAYALMNVMWLSIAFYGCWSIAIRWGISPPVSALLAVSWLTMPMIWWHASYSLLLLGIALLPFYSYMALNLFEYFDASSRSRMYNYITYQLTVIIAVFMDGYSFMMFATSASILGLYALFKFKDRRKILLYVRLPIHAISFSVAYALYAYYVGKLEFSVSSVDFFRGWGVDLNFLVIPPAGIHWLWDQLGLSIWRSNIEQFGDASVWLSTFAIPLLLLALRAWWRMRNSTEPVLVFVFIAFTGLYMGMGPSIKLNSIKPEGVTGALMSAEYAVAPTGSSLVSMNVPGFRGMRASYRWVALGFLGLWLVLVLAISEEKVKYVSYLSFLLVVCFVISNLPDIPNKISRNMSYRDAFIDIDRTLLSDLQRDLSPGEKVAFLPFRNDFFINYLASRLNIYTYNIGGDKNLSMARQYWPETMVGFVPGKVDRSFSKRLLILLEHREADIVVLPYIDMLWAAHTWPAPLKYKDEINGVIEELEKSNLVSIENRKFYSVVKLIEQH